MPSFATFKSTSAACHVMSSQHRPSVCLSVTFVRSTQTIEIFSNVLRHLVRWPSVDFQVKFYRDRPRRTPPSGALNARTVDKYSDFGPIEGYISETVQDRR